MGWGGESTFGDEVKREGGDREDDDGDQEASGREFGGGHPAEAIVDAVAEHVSADIADFFGRNVLFDFGLGRAWGVGLTAELVLVHDLEHSPLDLAGVEGAVLGLLRHQLGDDRVEFRGTVGGQEAGAGRLGPEVHFEKLGEIFGDVRLLAGQHFVEAAAEGVEVGFAGDRGGSHDLFGGHVGVGTDGQAGIGEFFGADVAGDPEIAELD